jgi:2-iminobutanoate/2-iminopropanoate deaminase
MSLRQIHTGEAPAPSGGYSQALVAGDFVFLSGQGPFDAGGAVVGESVADQLRQAVANLDAVAREAGSSLDRFVRVGVYMNDLDQFDEMDRAYREIFREPRPARTTIQTALTGFLIEVDAVAFLGA